MKNPAQVAQKWSRNLQGSTESITAGVQAVTQAPSAAAIKQQDAMLTNFTNAVTSGKWARNLGRVSLQEWQDKLLKVGVPRITAGAAAAVPKMQSFMESFLPWVDQGVNALKATPRGGLEQNITRAVTMIRHNANFKRQ